MVCVIERTITCEYNPTIFFQVRTYEILLGEREDKLNRKMDFNLGNKMNTMYNQS